MWAVIIVLPKVQIEFGVDRAAASLPYTLMMFGFAFGTIVLGRMADRTGIVAPIMIAGALSWPRLRSGRPRAQSARFSRRRMAC